MNRQEIQPDTENASSGEHLGQTKAEPDIARSEASPSTEENNCTLPPGQHPYDPAKKDIDPVGFALYRVQTFLVWIDEHRAGFEKLRQSDQEAAESELSNLRDSTVQAMIYLERLSELILAGCSIDADKRLPESLSRGWFASFVKRLDGKEVDGQRQHKGHHENTTGTGRE